MTKRRRAPAPILNPEWTWHNAASHDAGSDAFRERQRERIKRVQAQAAPVNVEPIKRKARTA